jgi:hypothetical protein
MRGGMAGLVVNSGSACGVFPPRLTRFLVAFAALPAWVPEARAEEDSNPYLDPAFELSIGLFLTESDTRIRLDSAELGTGTELDFEDDLGFDTSETLWRADAIWRFGRQQKHRLELSYFSHQRVGEITLDETIQFGDEIFDLHADIRSEFSAELLKAGYTYSFYRAGGFTGGASLGAFVTKVKASISETNLGQTEAEQISLPLPAVGLRGDWRLSKKLVWRNSGDVFFIDTKRYGGTLFDVRSTLEYSVTRNVALGLSYNYLHIDGDLKSRSSDAVLAAQWGMHGLVSYMKLMF